MKNIEAYAEIDEILKYIPSYYSEKIPLKLKEMFTKEKSLEHKLNIDEQKPLNKQKLKEETLVLLAMLKYNYWCESQDEKQSLLNLFNENEKIYQNKLKEKYNTDNLFKNRDQVFSEKVEKSVEMTVYKKQNFLSQIIEKIKSFFIKNNK